MSEHQTLWDFAETARREVVPEPSPPPPAPATEEAPAEPPSRPARRKRGAAGTDDKDQTRQATIKRLRSSGHWLTLLRVARTIPQPFTLNDISVAVWRSCPDFFGMKGYPYPDNHKVHYILYGDRGLIAKGLIQRVRQGLFRVPDDLNLEDLAALGL